MNCLIIKVAYSTERDCVTMLRLTRQAVTDLCHLVADDIEPLANHPHALPVAVKVTAALYFYAGGTFQNPIVGLGGISQPAISTAIKAVTASIVRHASRYIPGIPVTPERQRRVKRDFMALYGFPGVLGAVDCTHLQLRAPALHSGAYVNRKGTHSINVQVICDASQYILNVFANYPGGSHDAFIMEQSVIPAVFERDPPPNGWLLGDNGYPLNTWCIVPYITPTTVREFSFNRRHSRARVVIERTFGVLKQRFRCLDKSGGVLSYTPQKVASFCVACCVLHNIAKRHRMVMPRISEARLRRLRELQAELEMPNPNANIAPAAAARILRDRLAEELQHH